MWKSHTVAHEVTKDVQQKKPSWQFSVSAALLWHLENILRSFRVICFAVFY